MAEKEFQYMNVLERFRFIIDKERCDPMVAATLVLASAVDDAGRSANMTDDTGNVNIRISGDIETSERK